MKKVPLSETEYDQFMRTRYGGIGEQMENRHKFLHVQKPMEDLWDFLLVPRKYYTIECPHCDDGFCTVCNQGYSCGHEKKIMSILCFILHMIRMEQTTIGKLMIMGLGADALPVLCIVGTESFCYQQIREDWYKWNEWATHHIWDWYVDEDKQGNVYGCCKLLCRRYCLYACIFPGVLLIYELVLETMASLKCYLPAPFISFYLICAGWIIVLCKFCSVKSIWRTREDLLNE
jgi:hypothetical protein